MNRRLPLAISLVLLAATFTVLSASADTTGKSAGSAPAHKPGTSATSASAPQAPLAPAGSAFTYQGRLTSGGNPANGSYDLQFTLYDAASGGNVAGGPLTTLGQTVLGGLFTVQLDFGQNALQGSARWLEIAVRQTGGGSYTTLSPRQPLTAAPYALSLMPGATITGTLSTSPVVSVTNTSAASFATAFFGNAPGSSGIGVKGNGSYAGLYGTGTSNGVYGTASGITGAGVYGSVTGTLAIGVRGDGGAYGVVGSGTTAGVSGVSYDPNGYGVQGTVQNGTGSAGVYGLSNATNSTGVKGQADLGTNAFGVYGTSSNGYGVYGSGGSTGVYGTGTTYGVRGITSNGNGYAVSGVNNGTNGTAVLGSAPGTAGTGVYGSAPGTSGVGVYGTGATGVEGTSSSGTGVYGTGYYGLYGFGTVSGGAGVYGEGSGSSNGVHGHTNTNFAAVYGDSTGNSGAGVLGSGYYGLFGSSTGSEGSGIYGDGGSSGYGVHGHTSTGYAAIWGDSTGTNSVGVVGDANNGAYAIGVLGRSNSNIGVQGNGRNGVYGLSTDGSGSGAGLYGDGVGDFFAGVYARGGHYAGWFSGDVWVTGSCCLAQQGTYRIDDPLDPANKYLNQAAVQSGEMLDVLSGNATTDAQGNAAITLPAYFQVANNDFRYQLTVIGQFAQAIVSSELKDNHFSIRTDKPNVKVSWQVTGVRQDPYAKDHPLQVEQNKPANEKGTYLYPKGYGQPDSKGVDYEQQQRMQEQDGKSQPAPKAP